MLGIPVAAHKTEGPAPLLIFLGIVIDTRIFELRLSACDETRLSSGPAALLSYQAALPKQSTGQVGASTSTSATSLPNPHSHSQNIPMPACSSDVSGGHLGDHQGLLFASSGFVLACLTPPCPPSPALPTYLRGSTELSPEHQQRCFLPITMHMLLALQGIWSKPPVVYDNVMSWATCCLGFFGFLRVVEFTFEFITITTP